MNKPLVHINAANFQNQLVLLAETIAQKLKREASNQLPGVPGFVSFDLHILMRQAMQTYDLFFYINADGSLHKNLISKSFEGWSTPPSSGVVGRIISVTQTGDAAAVQLSFDSDKSGGWIDFHNLLRIKGVWKITNKSATHASR